MGVEYSTPSEDTVFGRITRGETNTKFLYEDDKCVVFDDVEPQAPVHFLVVPRKPITRLSDVQDEDKELMGHLILVARLVAKTKELEEGYRIIINDGTEGGQVVYHLHVHVMGGRQLNWPPG